MRHINRCVFMIFTLFGAKARFMLFALQSVTKLLSWEGFVEWNLGQVAYPASASKQYDLINLNCAAPTCYVIAKSKWHFVYIGTHTWFGIAIFFQVNFKYLINNVSLTLVFQGKVALMPFPKFLLLVDSVKALLHYKMFMLI